MGDRQEIPPRNGEGDHPQDGGGGPGSSGGPLRQPAAATSPFRGGFISAYLLALGIFIADQLSKWLMLGPLELQQRGQIELLPIFALTYVENHGISGGLFHASSDTMRWALVAMTAAIAVVVAWWIRREEALADRLALGLVLGGALGNIADRSRMGYVVDFADLHFGTFRPFLVFNVGDAAISIGVVILLVRAFVVSRKAKSESSEHA